MNSEPFRPGFHYTPRRNWMNDPNGLVYHAGEYHLFYQYNPHGPDWGHMSWGHAVSTDLIHWHELPVAIPETDVMIFSGSAVIDRHNVSGFGAGAMIAAYTAFHEARANQSQHLAFSHDNGRTFTHYAANPVIDLGHPDFRDPKLFYHTPSRAWIMVAVLATDHRVLIYRSQNLVDWALASKFGPAGATTGQWECPDLFEVPIEGAPGSTRWLLKVDIDHGYVDHGSGAQYFTGTFDGHRFVADNTEGSPVDFGTDFYAAVTWGDLPATQPGPVCIGWMSNHQTGRLYPTDTWRGAQSIPRRLFLFEESGQFKLGQTPICALNQLRGPETSLAPGPLPKTITPAGNSFEAQIALSLAPTTVVTVSLMDANGPLVTASFDANRATMAFARTPTLTPEFGRKTSTMIPGFDTVDLQILFDHSIVEIFINGGRRIYSACVFPTGNIHLQLTTNGKAHLNSAIHWPLADAIAHTLRSPPVEGKGPVGACHAD